MTFNKSVLLLYWSLPDNHHLLDHSERWLHHNTTDMCYSPLYFNVVSSLKVFGAPFMVVGKDNPQNIIFWGSDRNELIGYTLGKYPVQVSLSVG